METKYWTKIKEFHGVQMLRDPETMQCRIVPIERPQPQTTAEPVYSQAAIEATERAVKLGQLMTNAKITTSPRVIEPEPKPMTFDEQLEHDWRHSPALRKEFSSQASYEAYMRAQKAGRTKVSGRG